jgi:hypothetical protein
MKMIIDRKRYDTSLANPIASRGNGCARSDSHFLAEVLYHTEGGAWFLHCAGGSLSKYASVSPDGRPAYYNETIVPLTEDQAADWLAQYHPALFEDYFCHLAMDA